MQSACNYRRSNSGVTQYDFPACPPKCGKIMDIAVAKYFSLPPMWIASKSTSAVCTQDTHRKLKRLNWEKKKISLNLQCCLTAEPQNCIFQECWTTLLNNVPQQGRRLVSPLVIFVCKRRFLINKQSAAVDRINRPVSVAKQRVLQVEDKGRENQFNPECFYHSENKSCGNCGV